MAERGEECQVGAQDGAQFEDCKTGAATYHF